MTLDHILNFNEHSNKVLARLYKTTALIRKLQPVLSNVTVILIYKWLSFALIKIMILYD